MRNGNRSDVMLMTKAEPDVWQVVTLLDIFCRTRCDARPAFTRLMTAYIPGAEALTALAVCF